MGVAEILTIIFVALKLGGVGEVAHWSWWAVFAPMWVGYLLALALWFLAVLISAASRG